MDDKIYRDGDKLVRVTSESPQGLRGVLLAVYEGNTPGTVVENLRTPHQLRGLQEVDPDALKPEWRKALRLPAIVGSKPTTNHPSHSSIRGEKDDSSIKVVMTKYVKMNPGITKVSLPFFMGMAIISVLTVRNTAFLALCIMGALWTVLYQCAVVFMTDKTETQQV